MSSSLVVLCPNGRRVTVKISNNSPLLAVLEDACQKQGFYPVDNYELRRGRAVVDLSLPFRFSGLTNNAKLELVAAANPRQTDNDVTVVIQTQSGDRVQGTFPSSTALWTVLTELISSVNISEDQEPAIVYMRQQVVGQGKLSVTTLRTIGASSGRVSLRLISVDKVADVGVSTDSVSPSVKPQPLPNKSADPLPTTSSSSSSAAVEKKDTEATPISFHGNIEFPVLPFSVFPTEEKMDLDPPAEHQPTDQVEDTLTMQENTPINQQYTPNIPGMSSTMEISAAINSTFNQKILPSRQLSRDKDKVVYEDPCERNTVIYNLDDTEPVPVAEVSDEFFEPTVEDVQKMHKDLQRKVKELNDAPLLTHQLRDAAKGRGYTVTVIRVILPDRWVLQGTFNSGESLKSLVTFVREHLQDSTNTKFHLYTTPPKEVLKSSRSTFASMGFVPAANIHLGLNDTPLDTPPATTCLLSDTSISKYKHIPLKAHVIAMSSQRPATALQVPSANEEEQGSVCGKESVERRPTSSSTGVESNVLTNISSSGSGRGASQKVPKWFKTGKK